VKVKLSLCLTKYHAMKMCGKIDTLVREFLTSALYGSSQLHAPAALPPMGPRAGLNAVAKRKIP